MAEEPGNPRAQLFRKTVTLQFKLMVDGARDALLIPVSLLAATLGLIRGGPDADREFRRVIKLGRRSERWINLFDHQAPLGRTRPTGSLDLLLERVESVVLDQYSRGRNAVEAREAIETAMDEFTADRPRQKDQDSKS